MKIPTREEALKSFTGQLTSVIITTSKVLSFWIGTKEGTEIPTTTTKEDLTFWLDDLRYYCEKIPYSLYAVLELLNEHQTQPPLQDDESESE